MHFVGIRPQLTFHSNRFRVSIESLAWMLVTASYQEMAFIPASNRGISR